jgi:hypothetical protein
MSERELKNDDDKLRAALEKCAVGFHTKEVVEDFALADGQMVLVKKRVTKRDVPPDLKAMRLLLDGENFADLSDEELAAEKEKILKYLKENSIEDECTRKPSV